MSTHWVFAYGSNMHLGDLERFACQSGAARGAILQSAVARVADMRLAWNYFSASRGGGAANVEPAAGATLHGLALEVDAQMLEVIDRKEGYPTRYGRSLLPLDLAQGRTVDGWLYCVQPHLIRGEEVLPTRHYLGLIVEAASTHGLPREYVDTLRAIRTVD